MCKKYESVCTKARFDPMMRSDLGNNIKREGKMMEDTIFFQAGVLETCRMTRLVHQNVDRPYIIVQFKTIITKVLIVLY